MSANLPFASVIVPTRNRAAALARCLQSLARQDYPADRFEVVVVNDGGARVAPNDTTAAAGGPHLTVLDVPHRGPAAARNAGVAQCRGEMLAFVDDDCVAEPGWLSAIVARLQRHPGAAVGGQVFNALPGNRYARASHHLIAFLYRHYHEEGRGTLPFFTTNNLGVRADTFALIGSFDALFPFASEDRDWSDRCLYRGGSLVYAPEAVVRHAHALTFGSFLRQHFRYGQGAHRFHRCRAVRRGTGVRLEREHFYRSMLRAPFDAADPEPLRVSALLVASQVIGAVGWVVAALGGHRAPLTGGEASRPDRQASPGDG